jgi:sugar lactone lactonase YvrE
VDASRAPARPTKGFAGGSLADDGTLYVAAHAAVARVDPETATVTGVLHQPCMNDLHHVAALGERLFVSNTGLGAVDVLDRRRYASSAVTHCSRPG